VFGINLHQVFLVVVKVYEGQIVVASLRKSMLWHGVHLLKLQQNMRLTTTSRENRQFAHLTLVTQSKKWGNSNQ
jgi:hypothetical protein